MNITESNELNRLFDYLWTRPDIETEEGKAELIKAAQAAAYLEARARGTLGAGKWREETSWRVLLGTLPRLTSD